MRARIKTEGVDSSVSIDIISPISLDPSRGFVKRLIGHNNGEYCAFLLKNIENFMGELSPSKSSEIYHSSPVFRGRVTKYHSEEMLGYVFYPANVPIKLHFLGDIFQYDIHWLELSEINNFMRANFNCEIPSSSKKSRTLRFASSPSVTTDVTIQPQEYVETKSNYTKYICSMKHIKEQPRQFKKPEGWDLVPESSSKTKYKLGGEERIFCLGCAMQKKTNSRYLMTAIDAFSHSIIISDLDLDFVQGIKKEFYKHKDNYDTIDQWLYDSDFILSSSGKGFNKKIKIEHSPSIYSNLSGELIIPNKEYIAIRAMEEDVCRNQLYNGNFFNKKIDKENISEGDLCVFEIENRKLEFRCMTTNKPYKTIILKDNQFKSYPENSIINMLEI